jgi:hypothetical protein
VPFLPAAFPKSLRVLGWALSPGLLLMVIEYTFRPGVVNVHSRSLLLFLVPVVSFNLAHLWLALALIVLIKLLVKRVTIGRADLVLLALIACGVVVCDGIYLLGFAP